MGLDTVELVMEIEKEFEISIPDDVAPHLVRLGQFHMFAVQALGARGEPADPAEVWERLKRVVIEFCAVREELVVPEAHIIYDLGLD